MEESKPQAIFLKDYLVPEFLINETKLRFDLYEEETIVSSLLSIKRNPLSKENSKNIKLVGEELELITLKVNDTPLNNNQYKALSNELEIFNVPDDFSLDMDVRIKPHENSALSGLYQSSGNFCTQCEAEGFRRITYYLDRPDVLSEFTTTITADKKKYPFLLSNGNLVEEGLLDDGRHWVRWHDPFKKPSYLFALVAGDLALIEDHYQTQSGNDVRLQIYVEKENSHKCAHAIEALKKSMRWDEHRFGREYDLDRYMIVAINDFNMGAMENKGLNIFNSKYVLANQQTATDNDFLFIDAVVGHEYFHNWSGNRVTCRDWFQLSLKEGLTIFREHEFCADHTSRAVKRIEDVKHLRADQFAQDAGPMAHPVRPDSYIEINNFYTLTIYEKGAEVIRMIQCLVGRSGFDKGLNLYFDRHDGQAVTIEDFVKAMEDANNKDLSQFRLWYSQSGTPELEFQTEYSDSNQQYTMTVKQSCPPTPAQEIKQAFHIPIVVGLIDAEGNALDFRLQTDESKEVVMQTTLELTQESQSFVLENVKKKPIPSLLRGFSAPVKSNYEYTDDELRLLMLHDKDGFNRWEARQQLVMKLITSLIAKYQQKQALVVNDHFIDDFWTILQGNADDKLFLSELLALPSQRYIAQFMDVIDVDAIFHVRNALRREVAEKLQASLMNCYHENLNHKTYELTSDAIGERALMNTCLNYLSILNNTDIQATVWQQFIEAKNMTNQQAAFVELSNMECPQRQQAIAHFYEQFQADALVLDKWFSIQASSVLPNTIEQIKTLLTHDKFTWNNPNRVRSVINSFSMLNPIHFHSLTGEGYELVADAILYLDDKNPQLSARLCDPFTQWRRHLPERQLLMKSQLERILKKQGLSNDTYEIVSKSL